MRAVFECTEGAYRQVGYWDVNGVAPVRGASKDEELDIYKAPRIVGTKVTLPDTIMERCKFYCFSEGKHHNQLTLTDAREIYNMRKWLCNRDNFLELSCDEEAEHITEEMLYQPVKMQNAVEVPKPKPEEEYSDWDLKLSANMRKR